MRTSGTVLESTFRWHKVNCHQHTSACGFAFRMFSGNC
jgi:hypothetical protein